MKKIILLLLCLVVAFSAVGCGKNSTNDSNSEKTKIEDKNEKDTKETKGKEKDKSNNQDAKDNKEDMVKSEENTDNVVDVPVGTEVPVIESTEELESIVDEFNTTEDPEKREELRKKLEAFLAQAEAASE